MKRVALVGVWLIFVALLLQLAGWIYFSLGGAKPIEGYGYPTGLFVPHDRLGYGYRPGFSGVFKGAGYRDIPIEINAAGFRDDAFDTPSAGTARIAFLGDSVVFGAGVSAADRFTDCLETADADAAGSPAPVTILNLGVNSYSFGHYLAIAETGFLGLAPTALVVGVTLNDFAPMEDAGPARRLHRREQGLQKPDWIARMQERAGGTYAGRFLSELRTRFRYVLMNADKREAYHTKWMRTVVTAWEDADTRAAFAADLDRFAALAGAAGVPFGFVLFPELNDVMEPERFSGPRGTVLELMQGRGFAVCDPYADFAAQPDPSRLFLAHDSVHYSPAGHRLMCDAVRRCLGDWGFLGSATQVGTAAGR
jgi:hypothetical protein